MEERNKSSLTSEENKKLLLLEEYKNAVQLYRHDDNLKQTRVNYLYIIQGAGLGLIGAIPEQIPRILIAVAALLVNVLLGLALARAREYLKFRTAQAIHLEKELRMLTTFQNEYNLYKEKKDVMIGDERMKITGLAKFGAQRAEAYIPWVFSAMWVALLIYLVANCPVIIICF